MLSNPVINSNNWFQFFIAHNHFFQTLMVVSYRTVATAALGDWQRRGCHASGTTSARRGRWSVMSKTLHPPHKPYELQLRQMERGFEPVNHWIQDEVLPLEALSLHFYSLFMLSCVFRLVFAVYVSFRIFASSVVPCVSSLLFLLSLVYQYTSLPSCFTSPNLVPPALFPCCLYLPLISPSVSYASLSSPSVHVSFLVNILLHWLLCYSLWLPVPQHSVL